VIGADADGVVGSPPLVESVGATARIVPCPGCVNAEVVLASTLVAGAATFETVCVTGDVVSATPCTTGAVVFETVFATGAVVLATA